MKGYSSATIPFAVLNVVVANWKSEGRTLVAPFLWDTLKIRSVTATFGSDSSYRMTTIDSAGVSSQSVGRWTKSGPNGMGIYTIRIQQTSPAGVDSLRGIYRAERDTLHLEIVQTAPSIAGQTPAIVDSGFGSTKRNGIKQGPAWIQKFVRQP